MTTPRQWFAAIVLSLLFHLLALAGWAGITLNPDKARGLGRQGVEIGLGLLGDLGKAEKNTDPAQLESVTAPPQKTEPPITEHEKNPPIAKDPKSEHPPENEKKITTKDAEPPKLPPKNEKKLTTKDLNPPKLPPKDTGLLVRTSSSHPLPQKKKPPVKDQHPPVRMAKNARNSTSSSDKPPSFPQRQKSSGQSSTPTAGGDPGVNRSYAALLAAHLNKHRHYPISSRHRGEEGVVTLYLEINRNGKIIEARISDRSTFPALNEAALRIIEKAKPFPSFPKEMPQSQIAVRIPISFRLGTAR